MNEIFVKNKYVLRQCTAGKVNDKFLLLWRNVGTLA